MVQPTTWKYVLEGFRFDLEAGLKPATLDYYCTHCRIFSLWVEDACKATGPHLVTKHIVQAFFHHLAQRTGTNTSGAKLLSPSCSVERARWPYYRSLKRFFSWAVSEGLVDNNPLDGIALKQPQPTPVEPYRREHIDKMLAVTDYDWKVATTNRQRMLAARNRALLLLGLESGLRLAELAALRLSDVDLSGQTVMVREGKMGKGRIAGFGPHTKKSLWRYLGLRSNELGHESLWVSEELRPLTGSGIQLAMRRIKRDAGLSHVKGTVHKLRHTFATAFLRETRDMKGCRILLGHSTLAMTERYTQFIDAEDALKAYNGKGPLDWLTE
jgi:site-specific recombinase XerD